MKTEWPSDFLYSRLQSSIYIDIPMGQFVRAVQRKGGGVSDALNCSI